MYLADPLTQQQQQGKGSHYIASLDAARSASRWHEVPELVRKVTKHAPHRKCRLLLEFQYYLPWLTSGPAFRSHPHRSVGIQGCTTPWKPTVDVFNPLFYRAAPADTSITDCN